HPRTISRRVACVHTRVRARGFYEGLKIATPRHGDDMFWTYHSFSVDGYEPWRGLEENNDSLDISNRARPTWRTFGRGDPFDVAGAVQIAPSWTTVAGEDKMTVDGHPVVSAGNRLVNNGIHYLMSSVLTASELIPLRRPFKSPFVYQGAYLLGSRSKAAEDDPPDHIVDYHPDGERIIWQTGQPGDSGLRRIEAQVIGGAVWEDDASGQVWLRRIRCTRERIIAHAP
ncbi:hypothetical protein L6V77_33750, partial [Myxococcota bacterium]|nr:hypothetical protein [Myxococcota bacterium]